ncbi:hypothetical protein [Brevundimonas sp.]
MRETTAGKETARRSGRPHLRNTDLETAYAFAEKHHLKVRALQSDGRGGFRLDFGDPDAANDDALDRELALLEARHGQGGA